MKLQVGQHQDQVQPAALIKSFGIFVATQPSCFK